jgi:hypothetical protein
MSVSALIDSFPEKGRQHRVTGFLHTAGGRQHTVAGFLHAAAGRQHRVTGFLHAAGGWLPMANRLPQRAAECSRGHFGIIFRQLWHRKMEEPLQFFDEYHRDWPDAIKG